MTLGTVILRDLLANRPAASIEGRLFFPTDVGAVYAYRDSGTAWQQINIEGPTGATGSTGAAGAAATISVGSTATGSAGSSAVVSNSGTSSVAVLDFVIPQGTSGVVAATSPLAYNSGTQTVSIQQASGSQAGYLSATDWTTFNSKSSLAKYTTSWTSQTSVTVTHSLGTKDVTVQVYDTSDALVIPESVTTTSTSVVTLTFGGSFSGRVVVIG